MLGLDRKELKQRLIDMDSDASMLGLKHDCIIIAGGAALALDKYIERSTEDIDTSLI